jgi:hypothetical protein
MANADFMKALMSKLNDAKKSFTKNEKAVAPKVGDTDIILMPGWKADSREVFWREFGAHYIKNGTELLGFYPCDEIIHGKPCPVCQKLSEAVRMTNDEEMLKHLRECRANRNFLVNAIIPGSEHGNDPVVMSLSKTAFEQLVNTLTAWGEVVFHETNPQMIRITRSGTGFDTKYAVTVLPTRFPMPEGAYAKMKNLDAYVDQRTDAMLNKACNAIGMVVGSAAIGYTQAQPQAQALPQPEFEDVPDFDVAPQAQVQPIVMPVSQPQTYAQPVSAPQAQAVPLDSDMQAMLAQLDAIG